MHSVNKADYCRSQSHGRGKNNLEEEAILKFRLLTRSRNYVRRLAMLFEDYFEEVQQQQQQQ